MQKGIELFGFLLGLGALVALFFIYQQKSRKKLLACKLTADVCWVGHYFLLGAFGGLIPNLVGIFRECVFFKQKADKKTIFLPILFILLLWCLWGLCFALHLVRLTSWIEILPIFGSCMVTFALWFNQPRLTKLVSIPVSLFFLIYNYYVGSVVGVINESVSLISIAIFFIKTKRSLSMSTHEPIFLPCPPTARALLFQEKLPIASPLAVISTSVDENALTRGERFAKEIEDNYIGDFKKEGDKMVHVSTYTIIDDVIYMTYYANVSSGEENPLYQRARLVFCPKNNPAEKTYLDLQTVGEDFHGKTVDGVYDTILMQKADEPDTLYLLWTASLSQNYYRLYRTYHIPTATLGEIQVNRLQIGDLRCDFSFADIRNAFATKGIPCKTMYADVGIMQKLSSRIENGVPYYYTGAYSGDLTFLIKSKDLITWEYLSMPDFANESKWENAVYLWKDRCYYFVRQHDGVSGGFLTYYDLTTEKWHPPVLIEDCQSRSDFILYEDTLYLFHAPVDRNHIGVVRVDTDRLENSRPVLQAAMHESCFYPFVRCFDGELYFSYTMNRLAIQLSKFSPSLLK